MIHASRPANYGQGHWDLSGMLAPASSPTLKERFLAEVRAFGDVPLLPRSAREIMALLANPATGMGQVLPLVKGDPSMAAHLLRSANAAIYVGTRPVTSIPAALARLGAAGVRRFLLSTSAARVLLVQRRPDLTARLQLRSVAVSGMAARIAHHYGTDEEAAFIAGLLHDVGWAVGYGIIPRLHAGLPPGFRDDEAQIHDTIEGLHTDIGALLATQWKLPPAAVDAIRAHHAPMTLDGGLMAYIVYAASAVCDGTVGSSELADDPVMRRLRLDGPILERLSREASRT